MALGVPLLSALLVSTANGCGCGLQETAQDAPAARAQPSLPPTQPVAAWTQQTSILICPKAKYQYQPGTFVWHCIGHPQSQSDPELYECDEGYAMLAYGNGYEYGECVDGQGTGGCFEHQSSFAREGDRDTERDFPSFRLPREQSADAAYSSYGLSPEANDHVSHWPAEKNVPGAIVRVEAPDGKPFCHLKVFDLRLRLGRLASPGEPVETIRIGFEVADPGREPDATVRLSTLQTATDARTGGTYDGLYRLKLANQNYFIRMMRRLPDET